jgi:hypothetical protein
MKTQAGYLIGCVFGFLTFPLIADEPLRNLNPEDILNLTWAIQTEVSPDGTKLLYSVLEVNGGQRSVTSWLCGTAVGSKPSRVFD